MNKGITRVTAGLIAASIALFGHVPAAFATVSQADVDAAQSELNTLAFQYANADAMLRDTLAQLDDTNQRIDDTEEKISAKEEELSKARTVLSKRVAANYKSGRTTLLSILANSSTFEELASNIYYADKAAEQDAQTISNIQELEAELKEERSALIELHDRQEALAESQKSDTQNLAEREAAQARYVSGLSDELLEQVRLEDARRVAEEQLLATQAVSEVEHGNTGATRSEALTLDNKDKDKETPKDDKQASNDKEATAQAPSAQQASTPEQKDEPAAAPAPVAEPEPAVVEVEEPKPSASTSNSSYESDEDDDYSASDSSSYGSGLTSSQRSTIVAAASSQIGCDYGSANTPGVAWDCSGLVAYAYGCAGISVSNYSYDQIASIKNTGSLQAGDVIGWLGNVPGGIYDRHVAIYAGNGMIIHANGSRVAMESLSTWSPYTNGGPLV